MDPGSQHLLHQDLGGEECWSEGATSVLIEAWGDRHLRLNRGSLQEKDWVEVAEAVNERLDAEKWMLPKTDAQCKNRIESLKKMYKNEKAKPGLSQWPFFSRLDLLIGNAASEFHSLEFVAGNYTKGIDKEEKESDAKDDGEQDREANDLLGSASISKRQKKQGLFGCGFDDDCSGGDVALGVLARAIMKFVDVYERVETLKQKQMMEMEIKRMEFVKNLELEKMKMFMENQINLEKLKRGHNVPGSSVPASTTCGLSKEPRYGLHMLDGKKEVDTRIDFALSSTCVEDYYS